jgi:hypothetical protein
VLKPVGDLGRQPFLNLKIAAEELDNTAKLAEPDDPLAGQIADVGHARERQQVVRAERVERDRRRHDELVVALVGERGRAERLGRQQLGVGAGHARGRRDQIVLGGVHAERGEQVGGGRGRGGDVGRHADVRAPGARRLTRPR